MTDESRPPSYHAILEAAVDEFSEKGFGGLRMEHVARRAGFNKSLVYHFFKDKDSLFNAALAHQFGRRRALLGDVPQNLGDMLVWWSEQTRSDQRFMRMILRESLDYVGDTPVMADARSTYYGDQVAILAAMQQRGTLNKDVDPDYLFLALLAIIIAPAAIPQVCHLITGEDVNSDQFRDKWAKMLHNLANNLSGEGQQ